ncbi:MAG: hypothetical protein ABEJ44_06945 [Halanaeroarchaeum sp.]
MTPRRILRIARLEVATTIGGTDRKAAMAILVVLIALGGMAPVVANANTTPGEGLYRVGITPSSPYYEPVREQPRLRVVSPDGRSLRAGELEVLVEGRTIRIRDTETGRAAAAILRDAVEAYNDRLMARDSNDIAAFPVVVTLRYVSRDTPPANLLDAVGTSERTGGDSTGERTTEPSAQGWRNDHSTAHCGAGRRRDRRGGEDPRGGDEPSDTDGRRTRPAGRWGSHDPDRRRRRTVGSCKRRCIERWSPRRHFRDVAVGDALVDFTAVPPAIAPARVRVLAPV